MWSYFSATAVHRIHRIEEEARRRREKEEYVVCKQDGESEPNRQNVR